jgi:hypothetical protein
MDELECPLVGRILRVGSLSVKEPTPHVWFVPRAAAVPPSNERAGRGPLTAAWRWAWRAEPLPCLVPFAVAAARVRVECP